MVKDKYCSDNNIKLFRIKYDEDIKSKMLNIFDYLKINGKCEI